MEFGAFCHQPSIKNLLGDEVSAVAAARTEQPALCCSPEFNRTHRSTFTGGFLSVEGSPDGRRQRHCSSTAAATDRCLLVRIRWWVLSRLQRQRPSLLKVFLAAEAACKPPTTKSSSSCVCVNLARIFAERPQAHRGRTECFR